MLFFSIKVKFFFLIIICYEQYLTNIYRVKIFINFHKGNVTLSLEKYQIRKQTITQTVLFLYYFITYVNINIFLLNN